MAFVTRREASAITGRSVRTLIRYEERGLLRKIGTRRSGHLLDGAQHEEVVW